MSASSVSQQAEAQAASPSSDAEVIAAVLDRDEVTWQQLMRRFDPTLREVVRHAAEAIAPLGDADVDDVMGDFWLRLVEEDFRLLRAFNPSRGSALSSWLTFQVAHVAHQYLHRQRREPPLVPLGRAENVADPRPIPSSRLRTEEAQAAAESALLADLADLLVKLTLDGKLGVEAPSVDADANVYTIAPCLPRSEP